MSFYAGSTNIFGKEIVVRQKDPNSDEWGEKPDEYVRLTDALRAWCNGTCTEEMRFCDDGPCPGVRRMLKVERVKLPHTCDGCKWDGAIGYGECHHCKRAFSDKYEEGGQNG